MLALVAAFTVVVLTADAARTGNRAAADTPQSHSVTIFYAKRSDDGATVSVGGLLQYDPDTAVHLDLIGTGACFDEGGDVAGFDVTTNDTGYAYFTDTFPASSYLGSVTAYDYADSLWGNCYPIGPDNTSWENAQPVPLSSGAGSANGYIALPGESRWFRFDAPPDSTVSITLSGADTDDAVAAYSNIGAADNTASTTSSLNQLSSEFAADTFSPSAFIPSAFIPSAFIPSAFIPSAFIPSAFIPSAFIPSSYSPSAFIPSAFIPSAFIPSAFIPSSYSPSAFIPSAFIPSAFIPSAFIPSTYSAAVNRSLITYSNEGGTADKTITINTWQSSGPFYVRVSGANGAADPNQPFSISISGGSGSCPSSVTPIGTPPPSAPATGRQTVIVTDSSRIAGGAPAVADMMSRLQDLAARPEVNGVVVDLAGDARVQALDQQADANPSCPFAENLVANAVRDVVTSYRANNPLKYVVVAGPDHAIPFFRHPDQTLIGNETGYSPPVADNSPSQASLRLGYTLSDNDYGASTVLTTRSDQIPVPDLAVGRLVESAPEISGMVSAYLGDPGGVLPTPTTSLVTGYDFLTLPANQVAADLAAGTGTAPDTLIAPRTQAPADGWTGDQLRQKVLGSGRHDIVFLAGHFSANDALAADYTTDMITTDLEQSSVDMKNTLVFSAGCHSGYNIDDTNALPGVTLTLDWPEEFARKQAMLIGGTGYQYGDTDFVAYSEQIDADFAHQLRYGTGPVSIGQALLNAKKDYLSSVPTVDAIGQKAVYEATLYGLPMASIDMPAGRIPAPSDTSVIGTTTPVGSDPGATLGLSSAQLTINPTLTQNSVTVNDLTNSGSPVTATYLSGHDGSVTAPYQPVLPLERENVSVPGESLRGALFLGGSYSDTSGVTPLTGAPTTEIRGVHTGFASSTFFPEQLAHVNYFDALDGNDGGATHLLVTPVQHVSDPGPAQTDTRRVFSSLQYQLFYSHNTNTYGSGSTAATPALAAAPDIVQVLSQPDPDTNALDVCVIVGGDPTAGVQQTVVTYTDPSAAHPQWTSQQLHAGGCRADQQWDGFAPTDSTSWGGQIDLSSLDAGALRFLVQSVSGTGLVSTDDNLGHYYSAGSTAGWPSYGELDNLSVSAASVPAGSGVTISADLTDGQDPISGEPVTFAVGNLTGTATSGADGHAQVTIPVNLAPGPYPVSAAVQSPDLQVSPAEAPDPLVVTRQPTLVTLAPTAGSVPSGDTSYTARVCATASTASCSDTDPPVADHTVIFTLSGPVERTAAILTDSAGQARFDSYGLPPGDYTLKAWFGGAVPGVGSFPDPLYAPATGDPATATFSTSVAYPTPPALTLPADMKITVPTGATGTVVSYVASAHDPVDPRPQVSCGPGSVTFFPLGTTTVRCTATDTAGNSASGSFTVTVSTASSAKVTVLVGGNQEYGSASPHFAWAASPPRGVTVSGTVRCTRLTGNTPIGPALHAGLYTIDPSSCTGLTATGGATITYARLSRDFLVLRAATTLTASPAVRTGTSATLSATLTRTSDSTPLPGQRIVFTIGSRTVCRAVTDAHGVATCAATGVTGPRLPATYSAAFAGSSDSYLGSAAKARL